MVCMEECEESESVGATAVCVSVSVRDFAVSNVCLVGPECRTLTVVVRKSARESE